LVDDIITAFQAMTITQWKGLSYESNVISCVLCETCMHIL